MIQLTFKYVETSYSIWATNDGKIRHVFAKVHGHIDDGWIEIKNHEKNIEQEFVQILQQSINKKIKEKNESNSV